MERGPSPKTYSIRGIWLAFHLLVLLAAIPAAVQQRPGDRTLRVMTYNIKHGQSNAPCRQPPAAAGQPPLPDCNLDLDKTIAVLRAHTPDIVALQEVDRFWARSGYVDQPVVIAAGVQMADRCFAPNLDHAADTHSNQPHQYGTAIVTRFPIARCSNTLLTTFDGWEQRGILGAMIDVDGVVTRVYSTHLQASRNAGGKSESGGAQRTLQVQDILKLLSGVTEPLVLMGDFNAASTSTEMKPLSPRLLDVWSASGTGAGHTSPARLDADPASRIDYIFVSPGITIASVSVPLDPQTRLASDHYPIVARIALP